MHFVNFRQHYSIRYLGHPVLQDVPAFHHRSDIRKKEEKIKRRVDMIIIIY